jgi:SAM-dependent methyltransferase
LLDLGWNGSGYELNSQSVSVAAEINRLAIADGRYRLFEVDWLRSGGGEPVDLIASSMVIEHLDNADERRYFERCRQLLKPSGIGILFVPACPEYWGIEDEIAGHFRRYTFGSLRQRIEESGMSARHVVGLTYPVSNLLYPLSEYLVRRAERHKLELEMQERTRLSGNREVPFKTTFPQLLKILLNETVMYPFHLLQKLNARNGKSMTIYAEFSLPI